MWIWMISFRTNNWIRRWWESRRTRCRASPLTSPRSMPIRSTVSYTHLRVCLLPDRAQRSVFVPGILLWAHVSALWGHPQDVYKRQILLSKVSVKRMDDLMVPLPTQVGQASVVFTSIAGRTRWRVICISPNLLSGKMCIRDRCCPYPL